MGAWFHEALTQVKAATGSTLESHPNDLVHDAMVGAVVAMCRAGNARKAESFYNGWARFAGYAEMRLLREQPIVIDLHDAVVEAHVHDMEVVLCR